MHSGCGSRHYSIAAVGAFRQGPGREDMRKGQVSTLLPKSSAALASDGFLPAQDHMWAFDTSIVITDMVYLKMFWIFRSAFWVSQVVPLVVSF